MTLPGRINHFLFLAATAQYTSVHRDFFLFCLAVMALFPSVDYELSAGESESHGEPPPPHSLAPDVRWVVRLAPIEPREKKVSPSHNASKQSK